mmetsp:Transcript_25444/g.37508  ORF Transcript_25444/g.37508 Transcript_25444/m.37508 type:complete len:244 (-) Transcript_25444:218-949(-)
MRDLCHFTFSLALCREVSSFTSNLSAVIVLPFSITGLDTIAFPPPCLAIRFLRPDIRDISDSVSVSSFVVSRSLSSCIGPEKRPDITIARLFTKALSLFLASPSSDSFFFSSCLMRLRRSFNVSPGASSTAESVFSMVPSALLGLDPSTTSLLLGEPYSIDCTISSIILSPLSSLRQIAFTIRFISSARRFSPDNPGVEVLSPKIASLDLSSAIERSAIDGTENLVVTILSNSSLFSCETLSS